MGWPLAAVITLLGMPGEPGAQPAPVQRPPDRTSPEPEPTDPRPTDPRPTSQEPAAEDPALAQPQPPAQPPSGGATPEQTPGAPEPTMVEGTGAQTTPAARAAEQPSPEPPPEGTPGSAVEPDAGAVIREYPRLVIALGPLVGPHAIGNEQCDAEESRCETKGSFFGIGAQLEVRARLYRPLYLHLRGLAVANVSPNDPIYDGLAGGAIGLGAYGRRVFGRAEYLLVRAFGDNRFEPPFFDGDVARDDWGNHAGMVAVGFRQPLPRGLAAELWVGPMFGPRSVRRIPQTEPERRVLTTFMLGLNLSWDAWK